MPERLSPYPTPTWRDHVESLLRGAFSASIAVSLFCDGNWWLTLGLGLLAFGWSVWLALISDGSISPKEGS